jgi:DNA polymerase-1
VIFLIDSSNLVYRCFYAIQKLTTSKGLPTNALHGVFKTLRMWIRQYKPEFAAMVVDGETPEATRPTAHRCPKIWRNSSRFSRS